MDVEITFEKAVAVPGWVLRTQERLAQAQAKADRVCGLPMVMINNIADVTNPGYKRREAAPLVRMKNVP